MEFYPDGVFIHSFLFGVMGGLALGACIIIPIQSWNVYKLSKELNKSYKEHKETIKEFSSFLERYNTTRVLP